MRPSKTVLSRNIDMRTSYRPVEACAPEKLIKEKGLCPDLHGHCIQKFLTLPEGIFSVSLYIRGCYKGLQTASSL